MDPVDLRGIRSRNATSIPDSTAALALFFRRGSTGSPRQEAQNPREESANRSRGLPLGMSYSVLNLPGTAVREAGLSHPVLFGRAVARGILAIAMASPLLLGDSPLQLGGLRHLTLSTESGTDPVSPGSP